MRSGKNNFAHGESRRKKEPKQTRNTDPDGQFRIHCHEVKCMELLQDGVIALLSAIGLASVVWLTAGALLPGSKCTNPELLLVLPLRGEAPAMEADLRELRRTRRELPGATIVLADCGMTDGARQLAEYYCEKESGVTLRRPPLEI